MVRQRDEDVLEPILPKHPPTERDVAAAQAVAPETVGSSSARPSWDRLVLVGCAVVATLALVVVALRANSIAEHQRVQTCQMRVYAAETNLDATGRAGQRALAEQLAECVGIDPDTDADDDTD